MTEPEDRIRRYAEAVARTQRPVEFSEIEARRGHGRRTGRAVGAAAAALCVVLVVGFVIVEPGRHHATVVEVSPTTTSASSVPARACAAATLAVTSVAGERLHPDVLPPGFVLTEGSETDLGARGQLTYTTRGGNDPPRVQLLRYHTSEPLDQLSAGGSHHAVTVRGNAALVSDGAPGGFVAIAWRPYPATALVVSGYKLSETELLDVADGVRYEPGTTFTYPAHPSVTTTRADALASAGYGADAKSVLTSLGEADAVSHSSGVVNHQPTIAPGVAVTTPVWVVWKSSSSASGRTSAEIIAAAVPRDSSGMVLGTLADVSTATLAALTDRSRAGCEPPFGVLTRSEVLALRPPEPGSTETATLTTLTRFAATEIGVGLAQCSLSACDPDVPVWVLVSSAADHRFTDRNSGPPGQPRITVPGSWQVMALDARTGPQDTEAGSGVSLGAGSPPKALAALVDLAPT